VRKETSFFVAPKSPVDPRHESKNKDDRFELADWEFSRFFIMNALAG